MLIMGSSSCGRHVLVMMIVATTLFNIAVAYWDKPALIGVVHVGGKVLCQDCSQGWNQWVHEAKPIKGCKVALICMDERRRIVYYGSDETNEQGQYDIVVRKYNYGKELNFKSCSVKLVSSPDPTCNIATNFAGGVTGVKLGHPTLSYRDIIKYMLGSFYYTTPMCDQPDTNYSDDDDSHQGTKY